MLNNIKISSSEAYVGLFTFLENATVRNLVFGSSCSFINTHSSTNPYVGALVGFYKGCTHTQIIENIINMASVTYNGNIEYPGLVGGIIGYISSGTHENCVRNSVNYGTITHSGTSTSWVYLGGIIGTSSGSRGTEYLHIQNCINYGTFIVSGSSKNIAIGGIVGDSSYGTYYENCVNAGKISITKTPTEGSYKGGIAGRINTNTFIEYCHYTNDAGASSLYECMKSTLQTAQRGLPVPQKP